MNEEKNELKLDKREIKESLRKSKDVDIELNIREKGDQRKSKKNHILTKLKIKIRKKIREIARGKYWV